MTLAATFVDPAGNVYPLDASLWRAPDGSPLMVSPLRGITRSDVNLALRSIWRYASALPLTIDAPISLGEGCTPMVAVSADEFEVELKLEWFSPTGSFKDRGASVLMSFLNQQGIREVVEDSSGNAGAAISAYGAAAGMAVTILVPAYTQSAKVEQSRAYGSKVLLIPGEREDTSAAAIEMANQTFYASHNWHPMFLQGTKTLGYEIWEDLGFDAPDNIVLPVSEGSSLLGCYIAFSELVRAGEIDRMPRLFATQPRNCATLHHALCGTQQEQYLPTVAEGTAVKSPTRLQAMVKAVQETRGGSAAISEEEIIATCKHLARQGIFTEPSSAHAYAGARKLVADGQISRADKTVVILTGTGLKSPSVFAK